MEHDGSFKWVSEALPDLVMIDDVPVATRSMTESEPAIADLDQDGTPEIVVGHAVRDVGHIGVTAFDNQGKIIFTGWANEVGGMNTVTFPHRNCRSGLGW